MALRKDFYYRQPVTESELDGAFDAIEQSIFALAKDAGQFGILAGADVVPNAPEDMAVQVGGVAVLYDADGQRIAWAADQEVDCSVDQDNVSTAVLGVGNSKWISVFAKFKRLLSDPRTDGNNNTVYFDRDESFELSVVQGAEGVSPTRPSLIADRVLLADIQLTQGQTQIILGNINIERRQDLVVLSGGEIGIREGTLGAALSELFGMVDDHFTGDQYQHTADMLQYGGGTAWNNGDTNPAGSVEATLDSIFTRLASQTSTGGADRVGAVAVASTPRSLTAGSIGSQLSQLLAHRNELAATTSTDGATLIGAKAAGDLASGTVRSQLDSLDTTVVRKSGTQTIDGAKTFDNLTLSSTNKVKYASRTITRAFALENARWSGSNWAWTTHNTYTMVVTAQNANQHYVSIPIDIPHGAVITDVVVRIDPADTHDGIHNPETMPKVRLVSHTWSNSTETVIGTQSDTTIASGYMAVHNITLSGLSETVDRATKGYFVSVENESGVTYGQSGLRVLAVHVTYTVTEQDEG